MNDNKLQVHNTSVTPYMATATKPADKVSAPSLQPGRASADGRQLVFKGWEAARMGLQPGDHVKFRCGVYFHHGIYVGDGRFIHKVSGGGSLATASFSKHASVIGVGGGLIYTGFEDFSPDPNATLYVVVHPESFHPSDTVDLAFSCLKARDLYRLMEANCEHFATWCKTGRKRSGQVAAVWGALLQNFATLSAFVSSIAAFSGFSALHDTVTEVRHERGRGLKRLLGLGRKTVTTTTVTVNQNRVLAAAAVGGLAGLFVFRLTRRLKSWLIRQQHHLLSFRLQPSVERPAGPLVSKPGALADSAALDNSSATAVEDKAVAVYKWRVRSVQELLKNISRALPEPSSAPSAPEDILYYSPKDLCFLPLREADIRSLPRVTSLKLARTGA